MQGAISVQVTANWVGMKGNKEDVIKLLWDKLQPCVRPFACDRFTVDQKSILYHNQQFPERRMIVVVDVVQRVVRQCGWVCNDLPYSLQILVGIIGLDPTLAGRQADANRTPEECLDGCCWSSKLIWFENFRGRITN